MTVKEIREQYPYLYETHMHTSEGSKCGQCPGADMVRAYKEAGYAGVMVTDHNWGGNTAVDRNLPWTEWIDKFFMGYHNAKAEGDRLGFPVFLGYEAGHNAHDFLIYGFTIDWMKAHPELHDADIPEQLKLLHSVGGMVIQAHPYREASYISEIKTYEKYVDGIEMFNAAHCRVRVDGTSNCIWNDKAVALANANNLPGTAGSDQHSTNNLMGGGTAFPTPLKDVQDYIRRIKNNEDHVLTDGIHWYDKKGNLLV